MPIFFDEKRTCRYYSRAPSISARLSLVRPRWLWRSHPLACRWSRTGAGSGHSVLCSYTSWRKTLIKDTKKRAWLHEFIYRYVAKHFLENVIAIKIYFLLHWKLFSFNKTWNRPRYVLVLLCYEYIQSCSQQQVCLLKNTIVVKLLDHLHTSRVVRPTIHLFHYLKKNTAISFHFTTKRP